MTFKRQILDALAHGRINLVKDMRNELVSICSDHEFLNNLNKMLQKAHTHNFPEQGVDPSAASHLKIFSGKLVLLRADINWLLELAVDGKLWCEDAGITLENSLQSQIFVIKSIDHMPDSKKTLLITMKCESRTWYFVAELDNIDKLLLSAKIYGGDNN